MSSLRVSFAQWPEGLRPGDANWEEIVRLLGEDKPDILLTNEMPFGAWVSEADTYDHQLAQMTIADHERGLDALKDLQLPAIISSRPVSAHDRLANEAFALIHGEYQFLHQKHFFPNEPGFYEAAWFVTAKPGFNVIDVNGVKVAALLCTELMFNEHARHYGRAGAELIVVPRASDPDVHYWEIAASMAAMVSGAFVATANRMGTAQGGVVFGGRGMLFSPQAKEIGSLVPVDDQSLITTLDIDIGMAQRAKGDYPCYVEDLVGDG